MNEPFTTLDPQHSDPNAVATPWEETCRILETTEMFWLSTVRADGRPHATPLVAVWLDGAIHFNTSYNDQKAINLRGNPHVLLTTGCTWNSGLAVVVEGDAVQVTDDEVLGRLAKAWTTKWGGGCGSSRCTTAAFSSQIVQRLIGRTRCSRSRTPRSTRSSHQLPIHPTVTPVTSFDNRLVHWLNGPALR